MLMALSSALLILYKTANSHEGIFPREGAVLLISAAAYASNTPRTVLTALFIACSNMPPSLKNGQPHHSHKR